MGRLAMGVMACVKVGEPAGVSVGGAAGSEGGPQRGVEGCRGPCHLAVGILECQCRTHGQWGMALSRPRRGTPSGVS